MENIRVEKWNNHNIRFVERDGEWWAVAVDLETAMQMSNIDKVLSDYPKDEKSAVTISYRSSNGATQNRKVTILSEFGIYRLLFQSRMPEAESFRQWVFSVVKELRKAFGLQGYEAWRVVDKSYQRGMMDMLHEGMEEVSKKDYIKANTIADKAIASMYGFDKSIKKEEMTPEMLRDRQRVLQDVIDAMLFQEKFQTKFSVSQLVYNKHTISCKHLS